MNAVWHTGRKRRAMEGEIGEQAVQGILHEVHA